MAPTTRHSTRQATEKVNEKVAEPKKSAGTKRKGSVETAAQKKKRENKGGKEDEHKTVENREPSEKLEEAPKAENGEESKPTNGE